MKTSKQQFEASDFARAMISPSSVFDSPTEVVASTQLSRGQKIDLLQRWALDAHALQRATDENMSGGESPILDEINEAISLLDPEGKAPDIFGKAASKI
jgi:hypothetical protein